MGKLSRTLLCTAALIAVSAAPAPAKSSLLAFRDTNPLNADSVFQQGIAITQLSCQGINLPGTRAIQLPPGVTLPPGITIPGTKPKKKRIPSFRTALARANKLALKGATGKVFRTLKKGRALRTESSAQGLAVAAMTAGSPRLALAAMLTAEKKDPRDRMDLVNAAEPLTTLGMPAEAIALLDRADHMKGPLPAVMGIAGRAVLNNNLGYADSKLQLHAKAVSALRKALSSAPALAEANTNIGKELVCAGRGADALKRMKDAQARSVFDRIVPGGTANALIPSVPIADQVLDLSAGKDGTLPAFSAPTTPAQTAAFHPPLAAMEQAASASSSAVTAARDAAQARAAAQPGNLATKLRRSSIANLVNTSLEEPGIKAVHDAAIADLQEADKVTTGFWVDTVPPKQMACLAASDYESCFVPWCQSATSAAQGRFNSAYAAADAKMREYWQLAGRRETGIAANLDQQDWYDMAMGDARAHADVAYALLLSTLRGWVGPLKFMETACVAGSEPPPAAAAAPATVEDPGACPAALAPFSGSFKNSVEIPPAKGGEKATKIDVSVKVSCSKVEVELSKKVPGTGDIISVFGKGEQDFKTDTTTVVVGAKGSILGLATGQSGFYITNGKNGIEDFGWRVGAGGAADPFGGLSPVSAGAKVWGGSENISFIGSIDYIPTAFGFGGP